MITYMYRGFSSKELFLCFLLFSMVMVVFVSASNVVVFFLAIFLLPFSFLFSDRGKRGEFFGLPWPIYILMAWLLVTTFWSVSPEDTFSRAFRTSLLVFVVLSLANAIPARLIFGLIKAVLAVSIFFSFLGVYFLESAIHGPEDFLLYGCWRGVFSHKNEAGAIAAISVILFMFDFLKYRNWISLIISFLSMFFLLGTQSKTSLILLLCVAVVIFILEFYRSHRGLIVFYVLFFLTFIVLLILLLSDDDVWYFLFSDPYNFTGRVGLWYAAVTVWLEAPFVGLGFRAVFSENSSFIIDTIALTEHTLVAPHAHNGYLDVLSGTGLVGFLLAIWIFVFKPMSMYFSEPKIRDLEDSSLIFSCYIFFIFRAFFESNLLQVDNSTWVMQLLFVALIFRLRKESRATYFNGIDGRY